MTNSAIALLRASLIAIFLGALLAQTLILPMFIAESVSIHPEVAYLATPYRWVVTAGIICLQVALACIWILLSKVQRQRIFENSSLRWVTTIICASAIATFLVLGLGFHLLAIVRAGGPGVFLMVAGTVAFGSAATWLLVVMRNLLASAIGLEAEMRAVI
ncbi:DUF2975 domain-containing protein [Glutamicibacter sp. MCAF14]|uniref:DUF2975 domain-containing protein n=1 Tax=Glutamicibacter sp. MCAF14 TaxID=3233043 RepID=UPI003F9363F5